MHMKWTLALAATLILAGCNGGPDEEPANDETPVMNVPDEAPVDTAPLNDMQAPANVTEPENRIAPPAISEDQQILDDAAASGMTSRLPDDAGLSSPAPDSAAQDHPGANQGAGAPALD